MLSFHIEFIKFSIRSFKKADTRFSSTCCWLLESLPAVGWRSKDVCSDFFVEDSLDLSIDLDTVVSVEQEEADVVESAST